MAKDRTESEDVVRVHPLEDSASTNEFRVEEDCIILMN